MGSHAAPPGFSFFRMLTSSNSNDRIYMDSELGGILLWILN